MSEMVERVARAIGEALFGYYESLEDGDSSSSSQARLAARAAIAAMREPTKEILEADRAVYGAEYFPLRPSEWSMESVWKSSIDAILNS